MLTEIQIYVIQGRFRNLAILEVYKPFRHNRDNYLHSWILPVLQIGTTSYMCIKHRWDHITYH